MSAVGSAFTLNEASVLLGEDIAGSMGGVRESIEELTRCVRQLKSQMEVQFGSLAGRISRLEAVCASIESRVSSTAVGAVSPTGALQVRSKSVFTNMAEVLGYLSQAILLNISDTKCDRYIGKVSVGRTKYLEIARIALEGFEYKLNYPKSSSIISPLQGFRRFKNP